MITLKAQLLLHLMQFSTINVASVILDKVESPKLSINIEDLIKPKRTKSKSTPEKQSELCMKEIHSLIKNDSEI